MVGISTRRININVCSVPLCNFLSSRGESLKCVKLGSSDTPPPPLSRDYLVAQVSVLRENVNLVLLIEYGCLRPCGAAVGKN